MRQLCNFVNMYTKSCTRFLNVYTVIRYRANRYSTAHLHLLLAILSHCLLLVYIDGRPAGRVGLYDGVSRTCN